MATYESISSTNFSTSESAAVVITKPSGLAVGDYMVAILAKNDIINESSSSFATLSGWTSQGSITDTPISGMQLNVQTKVATSGDVAASNFTFDPQVPCYGGGAILRLSNFGRFNSIEFDSSGGTTTISYTASSTPFIANSLIITAFFNRDGSNSEAASSYTSTPSVTFTERLDMFEDTSAENVHLAIATGTYSGVSQVTAYGCTLASASSDCGCLIIINPVQNVTPDVAHVAVPPTAFGVVATNNATADVAHVAVLPNINSVSIKDSSDDIQWTNPDKPTTIWVNTDK